MPWTLARYVSSVIVRNYVLFAVITVAVASLIGFLENRDGLLDRPGIDGLDMVTVSLLGAPAIYSLLAGFIALLTMLVSCLSLLRHSELKVILAAGASYGQVLCALAPAVLAVIGVHFVAENIVLPRANDALRERGMATAASDRPGAPNAVWVRRDDFVLAVGALRERSRTLRDVELFALDGAGRMIWHVAAPRATLEGGALIMPQSVRTDAGIARTTRLHDFRYATGLGFEDLSLLAVQPRQASAWALAAVLNQSSAVSYPRRVYELWLNRKLSAPITSGLFVLLLASLIPLAHRLGPLKLLLSGVGAGFLWFVADAILTSMAEAGAIVPLAGSWGMALLLGIPIAAPLLLRESGRPASG